MPTLGMISSTEDAVDGLAFANSPSTIATSRLPRENHTFSQEVSVDVLDQSMK